MKGELKKRQKIMYGIGEISVTLSGTTVSFLYVFYLTNVMGMAAAMAGLVFLIGSVWDAVTDPLVGYISDITRSRFGKRRVYFLFTSVPLCLSFFLMWIVPAGSQWGMFAYATLTYVFYRTVLTCFVIPYNTYGMEIVDNYDGRTSVVSYRYFFSILFGLVAAAVPEMLTTLPLDPAVPEGMPSVAGYMFMAGIISIPLFISPLLVFFASKEEPFNAIPRTSFFGRLKTAFKNKFFRKGLAMYVCNWIAISFITSILIYYLNIVLDQGDNFALIAAIIMGMATISLPVWVWISKKYDKRRAYIVGLVICIVMFGLLLFPKDFVNSIIWVILPIIGFGMSSMHMIPSAIVPEAIEAGEPNLNSVNTGVYFGVLTFSEKLGTAVVVQIAMIVMELFGYISTEEGQVVTQPIAAQECIHYMFGLVPILFMIGGIIVAKRFPIGRKESEKLHAAVPTKNEA